MPTDDDVDALADIAAEGIHEPDFVPFNVDWASERGPNFKRDFVQFHWKTRTEWTTPNFELPFAVILEGKPIGVQGVTVENFPGTHHVLTGSWLGAKYQGNGLGKEARCAVLALVFDHVGAVSAATGARVGNVASKRVTSALGYEPNGVEFTSPQGERVEVERFLITQEVWNRHDESHFRCPVEVEGGDIVRRLFNG